MSKRHGATSVTEYARQGYLPEAMTNFLALLGWSPGATDQELFSRAGLIESFDLGGISGGNAVFNPEKLDWFNQQHIQRLAPDEVARRVQPSLASAGLWDDALVGDRHAWFFAVLELLKPRVKKLDDIVEVGRFFFVDVPEYDAAAVDKHLRPEGIAAHLRALDAAFGALATFDAASTEAALRTVADATGVKAATLIHAVRVAVTGRTASPGPVRGAGAARPRAHAGAPGGRASVDFRRPQLSGRSISHGQATETGAVAVEAKGFSLVSARPEPSAGKMFSISAFIAESYGQAWHIGCSPSIRAHHETGVREEGVVAKEDRGFASMDRSKQREIASKGGKAAHQKGTAHEWTSEEAREAGRKGGMASHRRKQEQQGGERESGGGQSMNENPRDTGERGGVFDIPGQ